MYNLTYEIKENGYVIYKDGKLWITQYEPYIPNPALTYKENAIKHIEELNAPSEPNVDIEEKISILEAENAELLLDSAMKDLKLQTIENDLADLTLEIAMGGM